MIPIFSKLLPKNINIESYIEFYKGQYLELNKDYKYYYDHYDKINRITITIQLKDELQLYTKKPPEKYNFKTLSQIQTLFMKSCLLESLKRTIEQK